MPYGKLESKMRTLASFVGDVDGYTKTTNTTSIPASIFSGSADFLTGARQGSTSEFAGRASICFLSASYLSDSIILGSFEQSKVLYGV